MGDWSRRALHISKALVCLDFVALCCDLPEACGSFYLLECPRLIDKDCYLFLCFLGAHHAKLDVSLHHPLVKRQREMLRNPRCNLVTDPFSKPMTRITLGGCIDEDVERLPEVLIVFLFASGPIQLVARSVRYVDVPIISMLPR